MRAPPSVGRRQRRRQLAEATRADASSRRSSALHIVIVTHKRRTICIFARWVLGHEACVFYHAAWGLAE
jgi:hypothetical protein